MQIQLRTEDESFSPEIHFALAERTKSSHGNSEASPSLNDQNYLSSLLYPKDKIRIDADKKRVDPALNEAVALS